MEFKEDVKNFTLRKRQIEAKEYIESKDAGNCLLVLPTGYGKTMPAKFLIDKKVSAGERVIFCSPLKALTAEQFGDFSRFWKTCEVTGESDTIFNYESLSEFKVYIFTYEKLESILMSEKKRTLFFDELLISSVIIDEIHSIDDKSRGANLETVIIMLKTLYPLVDILGLSATIGNYEDFGKWLNAKIIRAPPEERPIPLKIELECYEKTRNSWNDLYTKFEIIMKYVKMYPESKLMVFCTSVDRTRLYARIFAGLDPKDWHIGNYECMPHGSCFHNAKLKPEERKMVENAFRNDPKVRIVFTTPTLAMGINMPADICIISDCEFWNWLKSESELIKANQLHQMLGRAGRPGLSTMGFGVGVVIPHEGIFDEVKALCEGSVKVESQMNKHIKRKILEFVTSYTRTHEELKKAFNNSLYPMEEKEMEEKYKWLVEKHFLKEFENDRIDVTVLGKMTAFSFIEPETALHLLKVGIEYKDYEFKTVVDYAKFFGSIFQAYEFINNLNVRDTDSDMSAVESGNRVTIFPDDRLSKAFALIFKDQLKMNGVINDFMYKRMQVTDNEVFQLKELCSRLLKAAMKICFKTQILFKNLNIMIKTGYLDLEIVKLALIPGIGDVRLNNLIFYDIKSLSQFLGTDTMKLSSILKLKVDNVEEIKTNIRNGVTKRI